MVKYRDNVWKLTERMILNRCYCILIEWQIQRQSKLFKIVRVTRNGPMNWIKCLQMQIIHSLLQIPRVSFNRHTLNMIKCLRIQIRIACQYKSIAHKRKIFYLVA